MQKSLIFSFFISILICENMLAQDPKERDLKSIEERVSLVQINAEENNEFLLLFEKLPSRDLRSQQKIQLRTKVGLIQLNLKVGDQVKLLGKIKNETKSGIELSEALVYFDDNLNKTPLWIPSTTYGQMNQVQSEGLLRQHRPETDYVVF